MKIKKKSKIKKYPNGGKAPIKGTKEQYQAYQDSLDAYKGQLKYNYASQKLASKLGEITDEKLLTLRNYLSENIPYNTNLVKFDKSKPIEALSSNHYSQAIWQPLPPVQPIIYQPENDWESSARKRAGLQFDNSGMAFAQVRIDSKTGKPIGDVEFVSGYSRPKQQSINIQSFKPDLLQGNNQQLEFNPIGFQKGSYFTREQQGQEIGGLEYFDKKTGKKLMENGGYNLLPQIFANGGISRFEVPIQQAQGISPFELPYNQIASALLSKQKQQDTLRSDLDAEDSILSSLKEGYDTKGLATEVRNDYNKMIEELSNQELDASKINKLKRLIRNDSRIGLLAKSAKEADLYDKYRQTHKDFNLWVQPQLDNEGGWKQAKDEQGNWLPNTDYQGYINNLTPYNYYLAEVDDAGKNLKANLQKVYGADASVFKGEDGYLYIKRRGEATRKRLDENDPQYKAALESVTDAWVNKSTPGSTYLHAMYEKNGLPFDRNEAKKIVDDRLKTFTFSEANRDETVDLAPQYLYGVDDETKSPLIPFGETPAEDRAALFNNLDFLNLHKKGEAVKSTTPIYTSSSGVPLSSVPIRTSDGYDQLEYQSMPPKQLNTITNSVRNLVNAGKLDQKILDKVLMKENLTSEEQKTLYPKLQSILKRLTENEKINSQYEGLPEKESEAVTMYYFGVKNPIAKNIGTGNSGNVTIYDPQTGNKLKLADLKKEVKDSEEPIQISTQLRGNNTYNYMFGENNDLVNPYQLFVNGKMYLLPSPKGWYGEGANTLNMKKSLDLVTNKFTNSYISAAPEKLDDEYDAVYDDQDNTYKIYHNGKPLEIKSDAGETFENKFTSPQEAATVYFSYKQAKK